jgi:hypothetical protein
MWTWSWQGRPHAGGRLLLAGSFEFNSRPTNERGAQQTQEDELDLIRLAEAFPELKPLYPDQLREQIDRG